MREIRGAHRVLVGKPEEKGTLRILGVDGRIILTLILKQQNGGMNWTGVAQDWDRLRGLMSAG
jgi:hypothetical protein